MSNSKLWLLVAILVSIILTGCIPRIQEENPVGSQEYLRGQVAKGFPNMPLYPKARVIETYGYQGSYGGAFMSSDKLEKVVSFYGDSLGKLGFESNLKQQSETNFLFEVKGAQYKGSVIVNTAADGKKTAITIAVEPR